MVTRMKVDFKKGAWNPDLFTQVTSLRTDGRKPFMQEEDCVVNDFPRENPESVFSYNYISLLSKETFQTGTTLKTVCEFDSFGAPLLVFTDDVITSEDGYPAYGHHFEVVAYEEGFNIWELNGKDRPIKAAFEEFPVEGGQKLELTVRVLEDSLEVTLCGKTFVEKIEHLPVSFHAGITACEGVNRFYSFSAE